MARMSQQSELLGGVSLFAGCSKKELGKIARAGDEVSFRAGSVLTQQDQTGREAFVIIDGDVVVKRNNRKVATLGPGSVVGELALLDNGPRTATAVCATDCEVFVIGARRFGAVLDDVPSLSRKMMKGMAARIRELDGKTYG